MKSESNLPDHWEKLAAARRAAPISTTADDAAAPYGFAQRIASLAMSRQRRSKLEWWARWSMGAAGAAIMGAVVLALTHLPETDSTPLLTVPALEIPGFSPL